MKLKIDKDKLTQFIDDSQFGSGTLAESLSIHPDVLHKVIALAEGEESLIRRIESVLKGSITENGEKFLQPDNSWSKAEVEEETADLTIDDTIRFILDNPSTRNIVLEIEQDKEHSRTSLLDLIKPQSENGK